MTSFTRSAATIATATRYVLHNGVVALLQHNPASQTVSIGGEVRIGAVDEPQERNGLAAFTGASLIRGTHQRSFQQIVGETEERGASVNAGGGVHTTRFGGRALAEDLPLTLAILADMLSHPAFPTEEIERLRGQFLMNLREAEQDTATQASRMARMLLYPANHPYSRLSMGTLETVEAIQRDDLIQFHQRYHPAATTIAIVGAIDLPATIALLEATFGQWQASRTPQPTVLPEVPALRGVQQQTIGLPGKMQSDLIWATHGIPRSSPDYYAASVANMILGRIGLGGRLGMNVRETQGLAYYVGSSLDADLAAGPWSAMAGVNPNDVERALQAILHEIELFCQEGPLPDELADAKDYMTGSLALGLETNDGIASTLLGIERYQLGLDFISRYPDYIRALTAEAVRDSARRYLSTSNYIVVVAGPEQ